MSFSNLPEFKGVEYGESIISFLEDYGHYVSSKTMNDIQKLAFLRSSLKSSAKIMHNAALANAEIAGADAPELLVSTRNWLMNTYHSDEAKQTIRDDLSELKMGPFETPSSLFTRIHFMVDSAGYDDAVKN